MSINIQKPTAWIDKWREDMKVFFSDEGKEMQLCLVAQGYEVQLFSNLTKLLYSPFIAHSVMEDIKETLEK